MIILVTALYAVFVLVAVTNLLWMRRPTGKSSTCFEVMIPARNEAHQIANAVAPLASQGVKVTVLNDASTDETAEVATAAGARVVSIHEDLPVGWTGKTRACHELSLQASSEWVVFLDADTLPGELFASTLSAELDTLPKSVVCVTGFPRLLAGRGLEPAYLGWVPWILLATNPFGIVTKSQRGHNRFTNGQFAAWRREDLASLRPYEVVRGEVLEDVKIGRYLARERKTVLTLNVSEILSVRMYETLGEAFRGMSKNSAEIANSVLGSVLLATFLVFVGFGWALCGVWALPLLAMLILSKWITDRIVRYPAWTAPLIPFTCVGAAITIVYSAFLKRRGKISWKGRTYHA